MHAELLIPVELKRKGEMESPGGGSQSTDLVLDLNIFERGMAQQ